MNTIDLLKDYKRNSNLKKSITCVESGEVWSSISEASIALNTYQTTISIYLKNKKPWKGLHFEYTK
jgi:hypothetical protein